MTREERVLYGLENCFGVSGASHCPPECPFRPECHDLNTPNFFKPLFRDAAKLIKQQRQVIDKLYEMLDETCKDTRERYGDDSVCGLCQYDGAYKGASGDWCNECPGFESDECFCMCNTVRELCGKPLMPEP